MHRTPGWAANRRRHAAHATAMAVLVAATTALGACRTSTPVPGSAGDAPAAVSGTLGAASSTEGGAPADAAAATSALSASVAATPTMATHLTAEDEAAMVSLIRSLFGPATGTTEPDMQDTIVRQVSTPQLRMLRGEQLPAEDAIGLSAGYVWIVGFRTSAPLTLSTFMADASTQIELKDIGPTASLAGPDGRTSVFYIVATQNVEGKRRFVPMSQGVLVAGTSKWSLDDLAKLPATP